MWLHNDMSDDEKARKLVKRRARAVYAAEKKRGEQYDDKYSGIMAKKFNFGLELKPVDNPVAFKKEFYDQINKEYAIRYLETLGANPTPATIRMIQKNMPLKEKMVSAAWKSRGGLDDRLYIAPHADKRLLNMRKRDKAAAGSRHRAATAPSDAGASGRVDSPLKTRRTGGKGSRRRPQSQRAGVDKPLNPQYIVDRKGIPVMNMMEVQLPEDPKEVAFEIMKRKYIFPFNTPSNPKFLKPLPDLNEAYRRSGLADPVAKAGVGDTEQNVSAVSEAHQPVSEKRDRHNMNVELSEPLGITMKNISAQQRRFTTSFPFSRLDDKVDKETLAEISKVLSSTMVRKLVGLTAHYLYWTDFRHVTGIAQSGYAPLPKKKLDELVTGLQQCWRKLETSVKKTQNGVLFVLPIILLSVRAAMEAIFTQAYPLWFAFEASIKDTLRSGTKVDSNGMEWLRHAFTDANLGPLGPTLTLLNGRMSDLFDPKRYYGRISALESSAEGIRILEKASRCKGKKPNPPAITLPAVQRAIVRRFNRYSMKLSASRGGPQERFALFYATSNHVNDMIPLPGTAAARKIMNKGMGKNAKQKPYR
jgi:hypothetical protein